MDEHPLIRRKQSAAPEHGPLPYLDIGDEHVSLGLADCGTVTIRATGIDIGAPDDRRAEMTWARLGTWACGQWYAAQGFAVFPGACVAKAGKGVGIVGVSRVGASVTGLQLTRHGFGMVSDGIIVVRGDGSVVSREAGAAVDATVADVLFADYPHRPRPSGRPRTWVEAPAATPCELTTWVALTVRDWVEGVPVSPIQAGDPRVDRLRVSPLLKSRLAPSVPRRGWSLVRKPPLSVEDLHRSGPPAIADLIVQHVGETA